MKSLLQYEGRTPQVQVFGFYTQGISVPKRTLWSALNVHARGCCDIDDPGEFAARFIDYERSKGKEVSHG